MTKSASAVPGFADLTVNTVNIDGSYCQKKIQDDQTILNLLY